MGDEYDQDGTEQAFQIDEGRLVEEVRKIRHSTHDRRKDWTSLAIVLSTALRLGLDRVVKLRSDVKDAILHLLSEQKLSSLWATTTTTYLLHSQVAAKRDIQQTVGEYRIVSNFFKGSRDFPMNAGDYTNRIVMSLLRYTETLHQNKANDEIVALASIFVSLPAEFHAKFFDSLCENASEKMAIIDNLPSDFLLDAAYNFLLRRNSSSRRHNPLPNDIIDWGSNEVIVFRRLVDRALVDCYPVTVIDALLMQKPFSNSIARLVVDILPPSSYVDLLDAVGSLWGEKIFVSSGKDRAQEFLTAAMIYTLKNVEGNKLHANFPFLFLSFCV